MDEEGMDTGMGATLSVTTPPSSRVTIVMEGPGFLYNMCRIVAGTLLEVGAGTREVESVRRLLEDPEAERPWAGPTMRAEGLCMELVEFEKEWTGGAGGAETET